MYFRISPYWLYDWWAYVCSHHNFLIILPSDPVFSGYDLRFFFLTYLFLPSAFPVPIDARFNVSAHVSLLAYTFNGRAHIGGHFLLLIAGASRPLRHVSPFNGPIHVVLFICKELECIRQAIIWLILMSAEGSYSDINEIVGPGA